jgi:hypothetical protein
MLDDLLFNVTDPRGVQVMCTRSQWREHVIGIHGIDGMEGKEHAVVESITDPDSIYGSRPEPYPEREVYHTRHPAFAPGMVRVVTKPETGHTMSLVTAFPAKEVGGVDEHNLKFIRPKPRI